MKVKRIDEWADGTRRETVTPTDVKRGRYLLASMKAVSPNCEEIERGFRYKTSSAYTGKGKGECITTITLERGWS